MKMSVSQLEAFLDEVYCAGLNTGLYAARLEDLESSDILDDNPFSIEWLTDEAEPAVLPTNTDDDERECLKGDVVMLKKYFYVLRPLLACEYIRENLKSPPMLFEDLLCYLDGEVKAAVLKLLELKMETSELGEGKAVNSINRYIEDKILEFEMFAKNILSLKKSEWKNLNDLFVKILYEEASY